MTAPFSSRARVSPRARVSLRTRLTLIILLPMMAISILVGLWQLNTARQTAADVFDRSLLSAALSVTNDVALSGGDALSPRTQAILRDTSGGRVYYHVYAPDGVIVAGYATPPVGIPGHDLEAGEPRFFDGIYLGGDVSGVRLQTRTEIDGFSGIFTTTVWQDQAVRRAFVDQLVGRALLAIAALLASVATVIWFGVRVGLRPLLDLEEAIQSRSSDELSPIRRPVPQEVQGIVRTLNALFDQVSRSMSAQTDFISNAAHQLRNPIAAVLSLAEAVTSAPTPEQARERSADLLEAAHEAADLSRQLLTLERAKTLSPAAFRKRVDLGGLLGSWMPELQAMAPGAVTVDLTVGADLGSVIADPDMLREALRNLVDNAVRHGGTALSRVAIMAVRDGAEIVLTVADDGRGIATADLETATRRFVQLSSTGGSGLGLPIASAIFDAHGGTMRLLQGHNGLAVEARLPS